MAEFIAPRRAGRLRHDVNRIDRIDGDLVLWHREDLGCADAASRLTLYGTTLNEQCTYAQTIASLRTDRNDDEMRPQFDTIVDNLNAANFGLGRASHRRAGLGSRLNRMDGPVSPPGYQFQDRSERTHEGAGDGSERSGSRPARRVAAIKGSLLARPGAGTSPQSAPEDHPT